MIVISEEKYGVSHFINPTQIEEVKKNGVKATIVMASGRIIHTSNYFSDIVKLIEQELTKPQGVD